MPTVGTTRAADRYTRAMLAGQPSHSAQSGPSRRAPYQSASDHVQNETRRRHRRKLRLFPSLKPRFAPIPVWPDALPDDGRRRTISSAAMSRAISDLKQAIRISPAGLVYWHLVHANGQRAPRAGTVRRGDRGGSQGRRFGVSHGSVLHRACGVLRGRRTGRRRPRPRWPRR